MLILVIPMKFPLFIHSEGSSMFIILLRKTDI